MGCCGGNHGKPSEEPPFRIYITGLLAIVFAAVAVVVILHASQSVVKNQWALFLAGFECAGVSLMYLGMTVEEVKNFHRRRNSGRPKR